MTGPRVIMSGGFPFPVPAGTDVHRCAVCRREFMSDRTPMAESGFCMRCRPNVVVACEYCGERCPGRFDGQERCQKHREMPSEELQRLMLVTPGNRG